MSHDPAPLRRLLPPSNADAGTLLDRFLEYVEAQRLTLYPAQEQAILELFEGKNVILNTPTGSGKSLVAAAFHFQALARGERSFYTSPIKALASEKFFALCKDFGPDAVGLLTGDASVNRDAKIICCTAEVLANIALREGERAPADCVVMDEFHYYADRDRGTAWQVPLLVLRRASFLLMSATLGPTEFFEEQITKLTGRPTVTVRSNERPVPLDFAYVETPVHETLQDLVRDGKAPIYVVGFTQRAAAELAQNLMSLDFASKEDKRAIADALVGTRFESPYGREVSKYLRHGIGIHHAGLLPKYRLLVEKLAQTGKLKVVCGTDTLGVGVNIPLRTVLFTKLCKYDGEKTALLSVRDFQQISGRAGRKGFDDRGSVVVQAPEHVIENLRLEAKAGGDKAKLRRIVRKKPPERGFVNWDRQVFDRLVTSSPEPLKSRFQVTHAMLLNVLERPAGGCMPMVRLIRDCHDRHAEKRIHGRTALAMLKSLLDAQIVQVAERSDDDGRVRRELRVNADLQIDFSLNQALSLFVLHAIELVDVASETYALDVLTIVESTLENPEFILQRQLDRMKTLKMAELKAQGVEFDDRIAELEKLEYPKPNRDFIYDTFNAWARSHPWVGQENIRPKSIAREIYETFSTFPDYVKDYELLRAEGLLLRYLSDVYKALVQTVPISAKTPEIDDLVDFFGAIVRQVDSSLLDEWERMRDPMRALEERERKDWEGDAEKDITRDVKSFTVLVRNALFRLLRALASRDFGLAAELVAKVEGAPEVDEEWTAERIEAAFLPFFEEHAAGVRLDADARSPKHLRVEKKGYFWELEQVVCDDDGDDDWVLRLALDLDASAKLSRPVLALRSLGR